MKEDYVTYEQAVKLKKLGFDWECDHYYELDKTFVESSVFPATYDMSDFWHNFNEYDQQNRHGQSSYPEYSAPTLAIAQKWLREVKKLHVYADINSFSLWYTNAVDLDRGEDLIWDGAMFTSYELALSAGIDTALTLLTEKQ